tara:strand:+ start:2399 stop:2572 length:174 start_codon:yes stop_codon:yes gene_type:complete
MSVEDIMYEAYYEGLREEVFKILNDMQKKGIMDGREPRDRYDYALQLARKQRASKRK